MIQLKRENNMNRQSIRWIIGWVITLTFILAFPEVVHSEEALMAHHMRGGCMKSAQMSRCDGRTIHQLFANHNQIRRSVEEIPGGIRAVTESDNSEIAALIKEHVPRMYERIENRERIPMMMMSSTLPVMAQNSDLYERQLEITSDGIAVTETSNDPDLVAIIRQHASEVSEFVEAGRPVMRERDGMMR